MYFLGTKYKNVASIGMIKEIVSQQLRKYRVANRYLTP